MTGLTRLLAVGPRHGAARPPRGPLPGTDRIEKGVAEILSRWPDVVASPPEDLDETISEFNGRLVSDDWTDVSIPRALSVAMALYAPERRNQPEGRALRNFFADQIRTQPAGRFVDGMVGVYLASFAPGALHCHTLAAALDTRRDEIGGRWRRLLAALPELLDPEAAPAAAVSRIVDTPDPHAALVALGLRAPHGTGIGDAIHAALLAALAPQLDTRPAIDRLFAWLAPARGALRTEGACEAIEALLAPWADRDPGDVLRSHLAETLIRHYQDPRVMPGGAWTGMRPDRLDILLRWLTREDMQFFCDVVTLTQDSHMWPPRRDFWLRLYDEGRIHAAWVAFSDSAAVLARRRLSPEGEGALGRFGRQTAGGRRANTSLLVMRIGRHVVVDGCHNYMTHIFDAEAPEAPRLYRAEYDCEAIRRDSDLHRAHSHIGHWADWVERHI